MKRGRRKNDDGRSPGNDDQSQVATFRGSVNPPKATSPRPKSVTVEGAIKLVFDDGRDCWTVDMTFPRATSLL